MDVPTWLLALLAVAATIWVLFSARRGVQVVPSVTAQPRQASKIERIKQYREEHGVGLKEAKDAIEAQERGEQPSPQARLATAPSEDVEALIASGNVIGAIKLYKEQHGVSLKEAKDAVERMRAGR